MQGKPLRQPRTLLRDGEDWALLAERLRNQHPEAAPGQRHEIGRQIRDAFYVDADDWRAQVVAQALPVFHQAVQGLARA